MDAGAGAAADGGCSYGYLLDARDAGLAAVVAETHDDTRHALTAAARAASPRRRRMYTAP